MQNSLDLYLLSTGFSQSETEIEHGIVISRQPLYHMQKRLDLFSKLAAVSHVKQQPNALLL